MAATVAFFAVKSIGLSTVNGRKPSTLLMAVSHNLREIQAEHGAVGRIDATRISHNAVLAGPPTASDVVAMSDGLLQSVDTSKLKRDHCQAIEAVFSLPEQSAIDAGQYFSACLAWVQTSVGLPMVSAVVHNDEAAPHMHVLLLPIQGGKHVGSLPIARPALKIMRESFFQSVAGPFGLKRDTAKVRGMVKKWAVEAVLQKCWVLGLPDANGAMWAVLEAAIMREPTQAMMALGIDINSIRPGNEPNPIGLQSNPIGLASQPEISKPYLCVGLANPTASLSPQTTPKQQHSGRYAQALESQQRAIARHQPKPVKVAVEVDGVIRVRDEYVHDLSVWE